MLLSTHCILYYHLLTIGIVDFKIEGEYNHHLWLHDQEEEEDEEDEHEYYDPVIR